MEGKKKKKNQPSSIIQDQKMKLPIMATLLDLKHCAPFIQSWIKKQELMLNSPFLPQPRCKLLPKIKPTFPYHHYIYRIHIKHLTVISFSWLAEGLSFNNVRVLASGNLFFRESASKLLKVHTCLFLFTMATNEYPSSTLSISPAR